MSGNKNDIRAALLDHVEAQVVFGDTKAALIVAADAILVTGYVAGIKEFGLAGMFSRHTVVLLIVSLIILVAGLILALIAVLPSRLHWRSGAGMDSVLLFSRIARFKSPQEYAAHFSDLSEEALGNDMLFQVYGKSKWAMYKYKVIRWSVLLTIASLLVATVSIIVDISSKWVN